jgi:hypothetical protein
MKDTRYIQTLLTGKNVLAGTPLEIRSWCGRTDNKSFEARFSVLPCDDPDVTEMI